MASGIFGGLDAQRETTGRRCRPAEALGAEVSAATGKVSQQCFTSGNSGRLLGPRPSCLQASTEASLSKHRPETTIDGLDS